MSELPPYVRTTGLANWNRYAAVNDEFIDVHMDPDAARAVGMPDVFGMGNLRIAYLHNLLDAWLDGEGDIVELRCEFRGINLRGDVLVVVSAEDVGGDLQRLVGGGHAGVDRASASAPRRAPRVRPTLSAPARWPRSSSLSEGGELGDGDQAAVAEGQARARPDHPEGASRPRSGRSRAPAWRPGTAPVGAVFIVRPQLASGSRGPSPAARRRGHRRHSSCQSASNRDTVQTLPPPTRWASARAGALDLAAAGLAAQLLHDLVHHGQPGGAARVAAGDEAAVGVERDAAAQRGVAPSATSFSPSPSAQKPSSS